MQNELAASHPGLEIQFLTVNEEGQEDGNGRAANEKDIPLLQDVDVNGDSKSDAWASWDASWRDLVVVDAHSNVVTKFNLTTHDLRTDENFNEVKTSVVDAAASNFLPGDCNSDGQVNVADLGCVSDVRERDWVLDSLNILAGDIDGNGKVGFADFLVLAGNFGRDDVGYAQGNIDLEGSVGLADFLILSGNFGKTPQAANALDVNSVDGFFGHSNDGGG